MHSSTTPINFLCPITLEIMNCPVLASDGHTYEKNAIIEWLKTKDTSPMTNLKISKILTPNHTIKSLIDEHLNKSNINSKVSSRPNNKSSLEIIMDNKDYNNIPLVRLINYDNILNHPNCNDLFTTVTNNAIWKHIITNCENIESTTYQKKSVMLHYIAQYCNSEIVIYASEKFWQYLNVRNIAGVTPFLVACMTQNLEVIKRMIDLGANMSCVDNNGNNALAYLGFNNTSDATYIYRLLINKSEMLLKCIVDCLMHHHPFIDKH